QGATGTQSVSITDNVISDVTGFSGSGIKVKAQVGVDSTLTQGVTITGNTIYGVHGGEVAGIFLSNHVWSGTLSQTAVISNNTLSGINAVGIFERSHVLGDGSITQGLSITGN